MKKSFLTLFFATLLVLTACATKNTANIPQFHPPLTEAEKALDYILLLDRTDQYLSSFIFKIPGRHLFKDKNYSSLFTEELQDALEKAYKSITPEDDEGGRYVGIGFITCGQDSPEKYFYATVKDDRHEVYIATAALEDINNQPSLVPYPYRMIKEGGRWKLDGIRCPEGFLFNTDFNYTK